MNIVILGGGPAGLYSALLIKKAQPAHDITIIERNPADVTYGWGVVFSDRTLASFQRADYKTYEQITNHFVLWDAIDVHYRDERLRCGGHVIASIARKHLLRILQRRCAELGITLKFGSEIHDLAQLPACDLLIAADGINSLVRRSYAEHFKPSIEMGKARYIWLGTSKVLDAFTFIFRENEHGLFQVHAYPSSGSTSTFIVECDEASWLKAGLDSASEEESLAYCQHLFAADLNGAPLLSNNSKWISFATLTTRSWHHQHSVLLGDAAHTAHFSIGSGTKLAMEDAIALASALEQHADLETALNEYEVERKPVVEIFQRAARESQAYFETPKRYLGLTPMPFAFQLLTRSGRITYDDLRLRDPRFIDSVDRHFATNASHQWGAEHPQRAGQSQGAPVPIIVAPPPMFAPLTLRDLTLPNRVIVEYRDVRTLARGAGAQPPDVALTGAGLVMTGLVAISADGRITPDDAGIYTSEHIIAWAEIVQSIHSCSPAKVGIQLSHAGRRGSTQPRTQGLDRPLREGNWPLLSASPLPYTPQSQVPKEMDRAEMDRVQAAFVQAARNALEADFDLVQLHFAHGYLLASFLSPLTNLRTDAYGGDLERRMRFPLEIFDAVRSAWPQERPISVALSVTDYMKGGLMVEDALQVARALKEHGCDIIAILAGQTTMQSEAAYGRGFLTPLSDRLRNEAAIPTLVGGYLTTSNEVNTILAAGRADLCSMETP
ncbi:MAG: FAD-dependent monooxygenase [Ktedonobacteraceae bacterium]